MPQVNNLKYKLYPRTVADRKLEVRIVTVNIRLVTYQSRILLRNLFVFVVANPDLVVAKVLVRSTVRGSRSLAK